MWRTYDDDKHLLLVGDYHPIPMKPLWGNLITNRLKINVEQFKDKSIEKI